MDSRTVVDYQDEIAKTVQEITFDEDDELRPTYELVLFPCVGRAYHMFRSARILRCWLCLLINLQVCYLGN
jgi:hypothetical protein